MCAIVALDTPGEHFVYIEIYHFLLPSECTEHRKLTSIVYLKLHAFLLYEI